MAVVECKDGVAILDTEQMWNKLVQNLGNELPEATKRRIDDTLPPELEKQRNKFCTRICGQTSPLTCQAKIYGADAVGTFVAGEVLKEKLDKVLNEPDPGDNGHLPPTSPYIQ